jgi:ParB family chromosome partitioning protein
MAGFNIMDILNNKTAAAAEAEDFAPIRLNYKEIIVTKHNKYSMDEIEDLATGIHMAGGLQQPLVVGRIDGEYRLVSGHRRLAAIEILVNEGEEEFAEVDCRFKDMTEVEFRMQLLIGNTFNRKMTDYDRMVQASEWKEVLQQAKKEGAFKPEKGTRTRDYIAQIMGVSPATIGELNRIENNATDEVKTQLKEGNITMTAAAAASTLPEEDQNAIAETAAAGENIRAEEIQQIAQGKKEEAERSKATEEQLKESVSDTDTTAEERENARRLHALKMLEKYYIYMSDEEVRILEAMLEDCKRRKREYGLEDCGSTMAQ